MSLPGWSIGWPRGLMALGIQKDEKGGRVGHQYPLLGGLASSPRPRSAPWLLTVNTNYKTAELAYLLEHGSDTETLFIIDGYQDTDYLQTVYGLVPELKTQEREPFGQQPLSCSETGLFPGAGKAPRHVQSGRNHGPGDHHRDDEYLARQAEIDPHDVVQHAVHFRYHRISKGRHAVALQHRKQRPVDRRKNQAVYPKRTGSACPFPV